MRFQTISQLNEINMSPRSLERLTADINATVGIEYEMVIMSYGDQIKHTPTRVHDYSTDIGVQNFDDIKTFFSLSPTSDRLMDAIYDDFVEWISKLANHRFKKERTKIIYNYLIDIGENPTRGDLLVALEDKKINDDALEWSTDSFIELNIKNQKVQKIWLDSKKIKTATDVYSQYEDVVDWPNYRSREEEAEESLVAKDFENFTGFKIALKRGTPDTWIVETDSSIESSDPNSMGGIEIISPPQSLEDAIASYKKVVEWCQVRGHQTNESTGLHINISLPNYSKESVDYAKLVLLAGDSWVLEQFERRANDYAEAAIDLLSDRIEMVDDQTLDNVMKSTIYTLNSFAHKLLKIGFIDKNTSIHPRENRIEFRAPGGDWLNQPTEKITNVMKRFIVALDAALDTDKYKKEYAKKMYTLIKQSTDLNPTAIEYFSRYAANALSVSDLKKKLRANR